MERVLIVYSTTDGQTRRISERLAQLIGSADSVVSLVSLEDELPKDLKGFDKIILGARIRYGKHSPRVYDFIKTHHKTLERMPNAFFSVNMVARKPDKRTPATNPYVKNFLKQIAWRPRHVAVFAGRINYRLYSFWDRQVIRFIMWLTRGPTNPDADVEFTDWEQVAAFARLVREM